MTWVIAHRGASQDCPENTRLAFDAAMRQGCDGIEFDVQLTRDGVPVIWHDRTLTAAGGGRRRVGRVDFADLAPLDAAARWPAPHRLQPIMTLEQTLERYARRTRVFVELKALDPPGGSHDLQLARVATRLIRRMRLTGRVQLLCFDPAVLAECRREEPATSIVLNLKPPRQLNPGLRTRLATLDMLSTNVRSLTPSFGRAVTATGTPLLVYTCNTQQHVDRAITAGATGIMSDRPGWLAGLLRLRPDVSR